MFYKNIDGEVRHFWFGLSTDGINPFNQVRSNHSSWPVMLYIYKLPPWLCMKWSYIQMPLLMQEPRQPENDIDVFLEPVINELVEMFETSVKDVWDEYKKEHVTIKAVLTNLPGQGSLSREKTKGYTGCVKWQRYKHHGPKNRILVLLLHLRPKQDQRHPRSHRKKVLGFGR
jgi:hypothetical protein